MLSRNTENGGLIDAIWFEATKKAIIVSVACAVVTEFVVMLPLVFPLKAPTWSSVVIPEYSPMQICPNPETVIVTVIESLIPPRQFGRYHAASTCPVRMDAL